MVNELVSCIVGKGRLCPYLPTLERCTAGCAFKMCRQISIDLHILSPDLPCTIPCDVSPEKCVWQLDYCACVSHAKRTKEIQSCFSVAAFSSQCLGCPADSANPVYLGSPFTTLTRITVRAGCVRRLHRLTNRFLCSTCCVLPVHLQPILRSGPTGGAMETLLAGGEVDDAMILLLEVY